MFGMLDYRAHKLYWLLSRPFWLLGYPLVLALFVAYSEIGINLFTHWAARFAVALAAYELSGIFLLLIGKGIGWCLDQLFYFFIDIVPSGGRTIDQAKLVVVHGDRAILELKPFSQWTPEDYRFARKTMGILSGMFFDDKIRRRHAILEEKARQWVERPEADGTEIPQHEILSAWAAEGLLPKWYEIAMCKGYWRTMWSSHLLFLLVFVTMQKIS